MQYAVAIFMQLAMLVWLGWSAYGAYSRGFPLISAVVASVAIMLAVYFLAPRSAIAQSAARPFNAVAPRPNETAVRFQVRLLKFWLLFTLLCFGASYCGFLFFDLGSDINGYFFAIGFGGALVGVAACLKAIGAGYAAIRAWRIRPNNRMEPDP